MTKFKAAFALLAVFVILAAPAYAYDSSTFSATNDGDSGFSRTGVKAANVHFEAFELQAGKERGS